MMVLVTGGSGSGKSAYAEEKVLSFGPARRIYIATMYPFDLESRRRIDRHRRMRAGKGFETVERYTNLKELVLPEDCVVLLECMSNLAANEMFREDGAHENTVAQILEGVRGIAARVRHFVVVTNEIFSEAEMYRDGMADYRRYLGELNQAMAGLADEVVEVVYGIPVFHKKGTQA